MVMFLSRPCQLGHSPAVAARFYAQSRSEVADKAAMENTVHIDVNTVEKVGSKMGPVDAKTGSKMGPVGNRQETEKNPHEMQKPHDKHGVLRGSEGVSNTLDETDQWAVLDSNNKGIPLGNTELGSLGPHTGVYRDKLFAIPFFKQSLKSLFKLALVDRLDEASHALESIVDVADRSESRAT